MEGAMTTPTPELALVTGASSGIGEAFARRLSAQGRPLVLVARDTQRLQRLTDELPTDAEVLAADLGEDEGLGRVEERLRAGDVQLLVNNAGFGTNGELHEIDLAAEDSMLAVNVRAVLRLSAVALSAMVARGSGDIVNVSSMAGFVPGGGAASYAASKAYVTMLSQSLATTYRDRGIRVLAVCPGFTRTEFHTRNGSAPSSPDWMWLTPEQVVETALKDLSAGRDVSIAGTPYRVARAVTKPMPDAVMRRVSAVVRSRRGRA
jgi:hypothetical protein